MRPRMAAAAAAAAPLALALSAASGCATASFEFVLRSDRGEDLEIVDKEVQSAERVAELELPRPDRPALAVRVVDRALSQTTKVRRSTKVERVRRADASLGAGTHALIWTAGWIAGGPIVWYPVLSPSAKEEAEHHARSGRLDHPGKSFHPWEIRLEEFERRIEGAEDHIRNLGPPRVLEENRAAGVALTLRLRARTVLGLTEGEVEATLSATTGADGEAAFDIQASVRDHVLARGLEPLLAEVTGDGIRLEGWLKENELLAAYQGAEVDWRVGPSAGRGRAQADAFLDRLEYAVGDSPVLEVSLINRGTGPLYRLWARVTCDAEPDGVRPLFVGRVEPGQVVDRTLRLWTLRPEHAGRTHKVRVEYREEAGTIPEAKTLEFSVK